MFSYLKISDPYLGPNTYGHLSRLGPERCYVMHSHLLELENGGWKARDEFERYMEVVPNVVSVDVEEHLTKATTTFFQKFRALFDRHMVRKWTSTEIVPYVLGGDRHHAKEFARWIVYHKEMEPSDDATMATPTEEEMPFCFAEKEIELGEHHTSRVDPDRGAIQIKLHESMAFLTENADPYEILKDPFIQRNWNYIVSLSNEKEAVDLFQKVNGVVDKSSWNGTDYMPFVNDVIRSICIHANHQQRCENMVQLCGLVSTTKVGENRRTCRAITQTIGPRRFNMRAIVEANEEREKAGLDRVKHLSPSEKMVYYLKYLEEFYNGCILPAKAYAPDLWREVLDRLKNNSLKASRTEQSHRLDKFVECLNKEPKNLKAAQPVGIDETSATSGKVVLRVLMGSNQSYLNGTGMDIEELVKAELKARGIKKEVAKDASIIVKRKAIRLHEYLRILKANTMREWKETDVREFEPQSREMVSFVTSGHHARILSIITKTEQLDTDEFHT